MERSCQSLLDRIAQIAFFRYWLRISKKSYLFFIFIFIAILILALLPYYQNGCVILGGEGGYVLNFKTYFSQFGFSWHPSLFGAGSPNRTPMLSGLNIVFLRLIEIFTKSEVLANFFLIFSLFFFPFFGMFLVARYFRATPFTAFLCSLFYLVNPLVIYELNSLNQWNVFSIAVMPLFFWVVIKYYKQNLKLFLAFGLMSAACAFAFTNPPMFVIVQIALFFSVGFASYYHEERFTFIKVMKKYVLIFISLIVFNLFWVLSVIVALLTAEKVYAQSFADQWLNITVRGAFPILARMFSFTVLIGQNTGYDFYAFWYNTFLSRFISLIPLLIVVYFIYFVKIEKKKMKLNLAVLVSLLTVLFFVKGNAHPFGFIYMFLYKKVPFFSFFKTPVEKFGLLYVFIFSLLLLRVMIDYRNNRFYRKAKASLFFYLVFCCVPLMRGQIISDLKTTETDYVSRRYLDKEAYKAFREDINKDPYLYRILCLPGVGNYQVFLPNENGKFYSGIDPVVMNIDKTAMTSYTGMKLADILFYHLKDVKSRDQILAFFNIDKILINEDSVPWFGYVGESKDFPALKRMLDSSYSSKKWSNHSSKKRSNLTLYEVTGEALPYVYAVGDE